MKFPISLPHVLYRMDIPSSSIKEEVSHTLEIPQAELLKIARYLDNPHNNEKIQQDFRASLNGAMDNPNKVASMLALAEKRNMSPQVLLALSGKLARLEGDVVYIEQVNALRSRYQSDVDSVMNRAHQSETVLQNEVV